MASLFLRGRNVPLSPRLRAVLTGLATLALTLLTAAAWLLLGYGRSHAPSIGRPIEVDLPVGLDTDAAATLLVERGLADNRETLAIFLRATGGTADFIPGLHLLSEGISPWEIRRLLSRSILRPGARITIPEGMNRYDIGARLEKLRLASKRAFLLASTDQGLLTELGITRPEAPADSAEGFLFPATYEFGLDSDARDIVRRLVAEANKRWEALSSQHRDGTARAKIMLGWGRRELLTLASIIEKEAVVDDERPLIASVFYNRLLDADFKPKRLQSDPTASYGCVAAPAEAPTCTEYAGKATPAILHDPKNRYSTYVHNGLPPGPISNPGARSMEAALAPATTRYFYFVAAGAGRHTFSETLELHNDAIRRGRVQ